MTCIIYHTFKKLSIHVGTVIFDKRSKRCSTLRTDILVCKSFSTACLALQRLFSLDFNLVYTRLFIVRKMYLYLYLVQAIFLSYKARNKFAMNRYKTSLYQTALTNGRKIFNIFFPCDTYVYVIF